MLRAARLPVFVLLAALYASAQNPPGAVSSPAAAPQSQAPVPAQPATVDQLAAGTEIRATLDTPLSAKTSRPGDRFTATVAEPARGSVGTVVLPPGSRIEGEVAEPEESRTATAIRGKGALSVRFRDLVLPSGQTLPLTATLISVNTTNGREARKIDDEGRIPSATRNKDSVRDVVVSSGGTSPGVVFGGPVKGLAIGGFTGGGYVLSVKGKDVSLPAQTGMVIRLDQPVTSIPQN